MLDAKDIMTKQVICIAKDTPILEAIELMVQSNITGIPVVEDDMTLIGILSEQDVLRLFKTYEEEKNCTANDFMTQPAIHFEQNELLSDVCSCLGDNSIRRVPVTSNGKVVGVISRSDILKCILRSSEESTLPAGSESR
jgi:CBS domain-containing protein